jgi:DNA-binding MarR family transcriptional regulator
MMPTWRALQEIESRRCGENDLNHWDYIILADVEEHPYTSQKEIAERIARSASRLAADVEVLSSRGLVSRATSTPDRRRHQLTLTPNGQALTRRVRRLIHGDEDELLCRLSEVEKVQLREQLSRAIDPKTL